MKKVIAELGRRGYLNFTATTRGASVSRIDVLLWGVTLAWGANVTVMKLAMREMDPLAFNSLRFALASLILLLLFRPSNGKSKLNGRTYLNLFLIGFGNLGFQIFFLLGLYRTLAATSALILAVSPALIIIINSLLGIERTSVRGWAGIVTSFTGIFFMIGLPSTGQIGSGWALAGDLLILAGAFSWSVYWALSPLILSSVTTTEFVKYTFALHAPILLLVSLPSLLNQDFHAVSYGTWSLLVFSALSALVFGFIGWYAGIRKIGNTRTAIYQNLSPIFSVLIAWQILGEQLLQTQIVGAALIFMGVYLTRFSKPRYLSP